MHTERAQSSILRLKGEKSLFRRARLGKACGGRGKREPLEKGESIPPSVKKLRQKQIGEDARSIRPGRKEEFL